MGRLTYSYSNLNNGHIGSSAIIFQSAGSNATQVIKDIEKLLDQERKNLPAGMLLLTTMSVNDFLYASIHEVVKTLIEAFILVFLVVFIFLQDFRSTLIPMIAIPVALVGTFFLLYIFGFTLNLLTLSALVLAIAIVVDDAIVVVEAVHAKLDQGYKSARKASIDAMNEIAGALISITLVMMLVFIPVSFLGGTSGIFYRQFGLTMAMAIFLSAINALTLSPALCAIFLKGHDEHSSIKERMSEAYSEAGKTFVETYKKRFSLPPIVTVIFLIAAIVFLVLGWYMFENVAEGVIAVCVAVVALVGIFTRSFIDAFNRVFEKILGAYTKAVKWFSSHKVISFVIVGCSIGGLVLLMAVTPTALVPNEDTGTIMGAVTI